MKEELIKALVLLKDVSPTQWELYGELALPIVSGGISGFFLFVKKLSKKDRPIFMFFSVVAVSFAGAGLLYVKDIVMADPVAAGAVYTILTLALYHGIFKPVKKKLLPWFAKKIQDARSLNAVKTATVEPEVETPGRLVV